MTDYLKHHFPVILHVASPVRLDEELKKKLNLFLPTYRQALEEAIASKGRKRKQYRFLVPHDMAVILLPEKFIIALGLNNSSTFFNWLLLF